MDYDRQGNAGNYPFKPHGPRADQWGGDLGDWDDALAKAKVGSYLEFWITGSREGELVTNFYIQIISETQAECKDCGGKGFMVTL
jgi:hypothetical protein